MKSKVFYVYYSLLAPQGFIEGPEFDGHYRGVFCFLVDDASTDVKTADAVDAAKPDASGRPSFSDAEVADQQDIRTFVHNMMSSLRPALDQQALEYRTHQPGVEQFVHGMLHRLKNELTEPATALHTLGKAIAAPELITHEAPKLQDAIRNAQSAIDGIRQLFTQLKGFSDDQRGSSPSRNSRRTGSAGFSSGGSATLP